MFLVLAFMLLGNMLRDRLDVEHNLCFSVTIL